MPGLKEGKQYRAVIDGCTGDGLGLARTEDGVVFVKNALRGEDADIRIEHAGRNAAWARVETLYRRSPDRVEPDCPYYTVCGGCAFRHMTYAEELEAKRTRVEDALRRIGGTDIAVSIIHGAEDPNRYRNKVQFPVAGGAIGYYQSRTHRVVDIEDCPLQPERAAACRRAVKEWMTEFPVPSYHEKSRTGLVRHLYLRFNRAGETLCCLVANGTSIPHADRLAQKLRRADPGLTGLVLSVNTAQSNVILGKEFRTLWGRDWLEEELCGLRFRLSVPSFFQVNRAQAEVLYRRAAELAGLTGTETVLDLYCGVGTISLYLATRAGRVIGAELVPQAIADAKANAARNGIKNAEFFCGDAGAVAAKFSSGGLRPDVVVVDPPRKGLAEDVPPIIAGLGPRRVVYVSCDPATLARDVKRFRALGYAAVRAEAVDMFPRTGHVETVILLSQQKPDDHIVVDLDLDELDATPAELKATYGEIKAYVLEKHGLKVSSLYISQVKRKCGLEVGVNYNLPRTEGQRVPQCPAEKEKAILDALGHFKMI